LDTDKEGIARVIEQYIVAEGHMQEAKADYKAAKEALLQLVPHEIGEHTVDGGTSKATVTYPSKIQWDSAELAAHYGSPIPPHVKQTLAIDKSAYNRLPLEEREAIGRYSKEVPGSPSIDVVRP
jgi:hypothetical protein